jgi:hypothetical protein
VGGGDLISIFRLARSSDWLGCLLTEALGFEDLLGNFFGKFLSHDRHFRWRVNPNPHTATTDLQHRHGNFLANENSLTNFSGYNQHFVTS